MECFLQLLTQVFYPHQPCLQVQTIKVIRVLFDDYIIIIMALLYIFADLKLTIQWIVTGLLLPISIISTALLCVLFFWLFIARKQSRRQQQTPLEVVNSIKSSTNCPTCDQQSLEEHNSVEIKNDQEESTRKSEHVYSLPRWSRDSNFSMIYNEAYQKDFSMSINAAYSSNDLA